MHLVSKLPGCSLAGGPTVVSDLTLGTPGQVGRLQAIQYGNNNINKVLPTLKEWQVEGDPK